MNGTWYISTWLAWAPVIWLAGSLLWLWLTVTSTADWLCGLSGHETCPFYAYHPFVAGYLMVSAVVLPASTLTVLYLAIKCRPTKIGLSGLATSAALYLLFGALIAFARSHGG